MYVDSTKNSKIWWMNIKAPWVDQAWNIKISCGNNNRNSIFTFTTMLVLKWYFPWPMIFFYSYDSNMATMKNTNRVYTDKGYSIKKFIYTSIINIGYVFMKQALLNHFLIVNLIVYCKYLNWNLRKVIKRKLIFLVSYHHHLTTIKNGTVIQPYVWSSHWWWPSNIQRL